MMLRLYDYLSSGNSYKPRLLLNLLGEPFELIELDIMKGETRTPEYLAKNANGRIPLLDLDDGTFLPESNAILYYLAEGTSFFPEDRRGRAQVLQWMFFEQYSHEPNIAVVRFWIEHHCLTPEREAMLADKREGGHAALGVMENHLTGRDWFVGDTPTIADIALYAYTHVAPEGGFELTEYPAIRRWLDRVSALPGYIPITQR
jgi:glutathione S-transferase